MTITQSRIKGIRYPVLRKLWVYKWMAERQRGFNALSGTRTVECTAAPLHRSGRTLAISHKPVPHRALAQSMVDRARMHRSGSHGISLSLAR